MIRVILNEKADFSFLWVITPNSAQDATNIGRRHRKKVEPAFNILYWKQHKHVESSRVAKIIEAGIEAGRQRSLGTTKGFY